MEVYKGIISGLCTSKEANGFWEPLNGKFVDCMGSVDILQELFSFDLEDSDCGEYRYLRFLELILSLVFIIHMTCLCASYGNKYACLKH